MPYKYNDRVENFEKYNVDYDALFNKLIHKPASISYVKSIEQQLENLLIMDSKPTIYAPKAGNELYAHKFYIGSVELFINFNITYIKRFLTDFKQPVKTIDIKKFGIKNSPITYSEEDGNHRISAKRHHNIEHINCYIHKPNKNFEFCFEYDKILYLLITNL
mgnify:CR=1 FL=1